MRDQGSCRELRLALKDKAVVSALDLGLDGLRPGPRQADPGEFRSLAVVSLGEGSWTSWIQTMWDWGGSKPR
jgi:hypothetical protein